MKPCPCSRCGNPLDEGTAHGRYCVWCVGQMWTERYLADEGIQQPLGVRAPAPPTALQDRGWTGVWKDRRLRYYRAVL